MKRARAAAPKPAERVEVAVYDGQSHLGNLVDLGCKVVAELPDGTALGTFANRPAASHALILAYRGGA